MIETVGFIGAGSMGRPIMNHFLNHNYRVMGFNRTVAKLDWLRGKKDGAVAENIGQLFDEASLIFVCVTDGQAVSEVLETGSQKPEIELKGKIIVDLSSISVGQAKANYEILKNRGAHYLDAPVSGGVSGATDGSLVLMAGGDEEVFRRVERMFRVFTRKATYVGKSGMGSATKLINQVMVAANILGIGQGYALAKGLGLNIETAFSAIADGYAGGKALETISNRIMAKNEAPGAKIKLHEKDLRNALVAASQSGVDARFIRACHVLLDEMTRAGLAESDHSAIWHFFDRTKETA